MRRLHRQVAELFLISGLALGCGFSPGPPGSALATGSAASSGNGTGTGTGAGGVSGSGTGVGLNGGDITVTGQGGMSCGQSSVPVMVQPPDILLVQDKSGSMNNDDTDTSCNGGCGANSKWSQLTTVVQTVVTATDMTVNWGLKYFSDNDACDASSPPAVPVAPLNSTAVVASLKATQPGGNTPTRDAILNGASYLSSLTDSNPKYLLLATDGLPNCPSGCATMTRPSGTCTNTPNATEATAVQGAITMAAMAGFPTFVIGIGNVAPAVSTLNSLAIAGGEPQAGAATSYYAGTDPTALENALNAIVGIVASCTIPLKGVPAGQTNVAVSVNNSSGTPVEVPNDATNGWTYTDSTDTAIQLHGSYCNGIKAGTYSNVQFVYACAGTMIKIGEVVPN